MTSFSVSAALSVFLVAAMIACSSGEDAGSEASGLSCVPNSTLRCLCGNPGDKGQGTDEGTAKCDKNGKRGKCQCGSGSSTSDSSDSTSSSSDSTSTYEPEPDKKPETKPISSDGPKACEDMADAIFAVAGRCGGNALLERSEFIKAATGGGDCSSIKSVRDSKSLYGTCIRAIGEMSCTAFDNGLYDPSCQSQLER